ncbi:MAG: serine hydrolase domain-containing protein, partial [Caldilineaceae bacterium]
HSANVYKTGDDTHIVQAAGLLFNGTTFVTVYDLTLEAAQRRSSQLSIVDSGFKVLSMEEETVQVEEMAALTPEMIAEWESFIEATMATFEVPGAVVGVVQGNELVYAQGFGFADAEQQIPMTPETHMMIGSTSKSFATLMMAQLVDEGLMTWDTPARQLFPDFAVKDPALSETITMRNLVCACTGVPRRDLEFIFNFSELDADDVVASLREFEFFTDFGEAFQYSNQMVTTGGYIAGHVAEPEIADLTEAYNTALAARVTGPLGMANTTFSLDEVLARGDFATPHGLVLEGGVEPIPLAYEQSLDPIAPAGALWSTLDDMARYMVLQLNNGATPEGEQIVSEANLLVTRVPQVKINAEASYGLGWMIGSWRGLPMIEHGGNTLGFTSDFAFLPTADTGVIVMANAQAANVFTNAARMWLLHELFGVEDKVQENVDFYRTQMDDAQSRLDEQIGGALDLVEVE